MSAELRLLELTLSPHIRIMPPHMPHYVLTVEPSIVIGGHFYRFCSMYKTAVGILDQALYGTVATNAHHEAQWEILRRMVFFVEATFNTNMCDCSQFHITMGWRTQLTALLLPRPS